jgi:ammonium transporter, Amt family
MMSKHWSRVLRTLLSVGLATIFLMAVTGGVFAQDDEGEGAGDDTAAEVVENTEEIAFNAEEAVANVQTNLNQVWLLLAGFLVFFMQAGFAMLEGGFIRQTGVVNSMAENFMDACVTGIMFFIVGFGIAYGNTLGAGLYDSSMFFLDGIDGTGEGDGIAFIDFFFQFAFAGAAATIATGAMAERTDFKGKLIYSVLLGAIIYPVVVHLTWGGGFLAEQGYTDFAGSGIVHLTGGVVGLVGAAIVGARPGREFGKPPQPSNLMLATLGTFILWFGWYGFNVGSTLAAEDPNQLGLVVANTTLAAATGCLGAMFYGYLKSGSWNMGLILNGSLAGLVGITAPCAFVAPWAALLIGLASGVVVVISIDLVEAAKIDDAVGAFAVHGACGAFGVLAVGLFGIEELVVAFGGTGGGLLVGGGVDQFITQALGIGVIVAWTVVASAIMFTALKAIGLLRIPATAEEIGIDAYEHDASVWPDVLPLPGKQSGAAAPATGD